MKVSVLTPTYNDEITIKETAKSLVLQNALPSAFRTSKGSKQNFSRHRKSNG